VGLSPFSATSATSATAAAAGGGDGGASADGLRPVSRASATNAGIVGCVLSDSSLAAVAAVAAVAAASGVFRPADPLTAPTATLGGVMPVRPGVTAVAPSPATSFVWPAGRAGRAMARPAPVPAAVPAAVMIEPREGLVAPEFDFAPALVPHR